MRYKARDGRMFGNVVQGRQYDRSLADRGKEAAQNAPGGPQHIHDIKQHGMVTESHVVYDGNGRWRLTSKHRDGETTTSVHPQVWRAHEIAGKYLNPEGAPPALETHQRSRSHPVGEKETERIAKEDGRDNDVLTWDSFEDNP